MPGRSCRAPPGCHRQGGTRCSLRHTWCGPAACRPQRGWRALGVHPAPGPGWAQPDRGQWWGPNLRAFRHYANQSTVQYLGLIKTWTLSWGLIKTQLRGQSYKFSKKTTVWQRWALRAHLCQFDSLPSGMRSPVTNVSDVSHSVNHKQNAFQPPMRLVVML